jgi:hypothetical protein
MKPVFQPEPTQCLMIFYLHQLYFSSKNSTFSDSIGLAPWIRIETNEDKLDCKSNSIPTVPNKLQEPYQM